MYLIPQNPTIYNRKWDLDHTEYQVSAGILPGLPSLLPSANPVVVVATPAPAINLPFSKRPCRACQCAKKPSLSGMGISPRGISVPPQKRMRGLHRLGDVANACVYYGADGVSVESVDQNSDPTECAANGGTWGQSPGSTTTQPAAPSGVPPQSIVLYTCTFTPTSNPLSSKFYSLDSILAAVVQNLQQQWGLSVTSQQSSGGLVGTPSATLTVQTNTSYAQLSDLKSIIDGAFYNAASAQVTSSQIQITKLGSVASISPFAPIGNPVQAAAEQSSILSWLSSNWPVVAVVGLVALKEL